jgi:Na+-driven multidrug efflux pump
VTVLSVVTNNLLAVTGGALALSAYAIAARIGTFVAMPQLGITQAMQPIVGYNHGAGRGDRAHRAASLSLRVSVLYGAGAALVVALAARLIAGVFTRMWLRLTPPRRPCGRSPSRTRSAASSG